MSYVARHGNILDTVTWKFEKKKKKKKKKKQIDIIVSK